MSDLSNISGDLLLGDLISPLTQQLGQVLTYGGQIAALAANSTLLNNVAKFLLLAAYTEILTTSPNPTQLVIRASDFVTSTQTSQASGTACPAQVPNCSNCGGDQNPLIAPPNTNTNGICVGLAKYGGFPEGCVCVNPDDSPPNAPYGAMEEIDEAVSFWASVSANAVSPATISTSTTSAAPASANTNPTTISTSTTSAAPASSPCNNGIKYISSAYCNEYCFGGQCTTVEAKVKRCEGCTPPPNYYYLCSCP